MLKVFGKNLGVLINRPLRTLLILIFIICLVFAGCEKQEEPEPPKGINEKLNFSYSSYVISFRDKFIQDDWTGIFSDSSFEYYDTLKSFYSLRNYTPLFIKSFDEKEFVDSLLNIFGKADEHGLNPEQYHYNLIRKEFEKAFADSLASDLSYAQLSKTELLISDALLKYSYHLRYGLVNPRELYPDSYFLPVVDSSKRALFEPLFHKNIITYLYSIQPKSKRYKNLQAALNHFKHFKDVEWPVIPSLNKKIETGSNDSILSPIIRRLITLGFIDSSRTKIKNFAFYDSSLVTSVKQFQRINGLNDDGVIGKNTIERLNASPQEYINKIKLNLERFRWNNYPDTSDYVIVNIPDFRLFIADSGKVIFDTKVCVGRKRSDNYENQLEKFKKTWRLTDKPENWQTPDIFSELSYLVLNPTWSVPESIVREEIFQKVSKDSSYLRDHNFKVYLDTSEVDPDEVTLKDLSAEEIKYRIVQDPGEGNALGKIKFMFPNHFGIYLHDTPMREPFKSSNRAVSHGCVRVENPMPLADFLLTGHPKWNMDFLKIEIGHKVEDKQKIAEYKKAREKLRKDFKDDKTTEIYLSKKVPLYIDYYTAWVDENGEINFRDDIYNKDKILFDKLLKMKLI